MSIGAEKELRVWVPRPRRSGGRDDGSCLRRGGRGPMREVRGSESEAEDWVEGDRGNGGGKVLWVVGWLLASGGDDEGRRFR